MSTSCDVCDDDATTPHVCGFIKLSVISRELGRGKKMKKTLPMITEKIYFVSDYDSNHQMLTQQQIARAPKGKLMEWSRMIKAIGWVFGV